MIFAVDFDGTVVTHEYPNIGKEIGATPILKSLVEDGHQLILWTMRSGKELDDAIQWFKDRDIGLYGIQENPQQKSWTNSPKPYAHIYIDDASLGCPLKFDGEMSGRGFVDWDAVERILFRDV